MDLWVRSQDKTNLIKVYDVYISERRKIRANYQKGYGCAYTELGEYANTERALEVLDEIHKRLEQCFEYDSRASYSMETSVFSNKVYQMPKE